MGFWLLASKSRPAPFLKGLEHWPKIYMFMWEHVVLGESLINTCCYMILHCQTRLPSSIVRLLNHGFLVFGCWLLNQGLNPFWKALNIAPKHIFLYGNKLYWVVQSWTHFVTWFYTTDTSSNQCCQAPQPWVFGCWLVSQGLNPF